MPRPAMLVETVTAPLRPACAIDLGFALVLLGVQHLVRDARFFQQAARCSDFSMEIVPTSTGWPVS